MLAVWWKKTPMIGHPIESVQDAQETVTDKDGNFTIPGTSTFSLISTVDEPRLTVFRPGYEAYAGPIKPIILRGITTREPYEKDGKVVVELRLLRTVEERLRNLGRISTSSRVPVEKYPNLIRLRDIEEQSLGLAPRHLPKGTQQ